MTWCRVCGGAGFDILGRDCSEGCKSPFGPNLLRDVAEARLAQDKAIADANLSAALAWERELLQRASHGTKSAPEH